MLTIEITAVLALMIINGLLAMSELAVVSSRRSRLKHLADRGNHGARSALRLIDDPGRFLSTVQFGITLVGIFAGAYSGATLAHRLGDWLNEFPIIAPHGENIGLGLTVLAITYLSLILGELVPKRLALAFPEGIAASIAKPMRMLSWITMPAVWVLNVSTEGILRILRLNAPRETTVTEDEVKSLIEEGTQSGVFEEQEQELIEGALRLADRSVRLLMTPRPDIAWLDVNAARSTILSIVDQHPYSRFLVCEGSVDHPLGVVHIGDLLPAALRGDSIDLRHHITPVLWVSERMSALKLLNRFKKERTHFAIIVDEHGSTEGLVTLTDIVEAIAGELPEQGEESAPTIIRREDGSWLADGIVPTDQLATVTGIYLGDNIQTLAGFVLNQLGRIPEVGSVFHHANGRFEVVDMDGNRIDKVLIENKQASTE
ncbi:HlyC/CorC family transporter [bacterium]|nr:MAG: HlyC/CorC family transporter [bacterium]